MRRVLPAALRVSLVAAAVAGCGSSAPAAQRHATTSPARTTTSTSTTAPASTSAPGPEGIPLEAGAPLAPATTTANGTTVDGIQCSPSEQVAYHIHAHLQVYFDGLPRAVPGGIGITGAVAQQTAYGPFYQATGCYYWLHTHTSDGVIHVESPTQRVYTLGNFFDEWRQPLGADRVAGLRGHVTATLNGRPWRRSVRDIPLIAHADIQLAVGQPVPPAQPVNWANAQL